MSETLTSRPRGISKPDSTVLVASFVFAWFATLLLLRREDIGGYFDNAMPDFFSFDQLAYAAIAANAAQGDFSLSEPFTQTGTSIYPSAWYKLVGLLAGLFGVPVLMVWAVLGISAVLLAVTVAGWFAYRLSRRPWAPVVPALLLWTGPLALAVSDSWFLQFESHAVIWGPYALLFPLNAETVGVSLVALGLLCLAWVTGRFRLHTRSAFAWLFLCGLLIGLTANIHTYVFFTASAIGAAWLFGYSFVRATSVRARFLLSLPAVVFLASGSTLRPLIGALGVFALILTAVAAPAVASLGRSRLVPILVTFMGYTLGALPQVVITLNAYVSADPFLGYRTEQSSNLGVSALGWVLGSTGLVLIALWAVPQLRTNVVHQTLMVALVMTNFLLAFNNLWGFGQEPYRFWIQTFALFALVAAPSLTLAFSQRDARTATFVSGFGFVGVLLLALSVWNVGGFRQSVDSSGTIDLNSSRLVAIADAAQGARGALAAEPCIDPGVLKVVSGQPLLYYSPGIAWPARKAEIDQFAVTLASGSFDSSAFRSAGGEFFITDSSCNQEWSLTSTMGVTLLAEFPYERDGSNYAISLWRAL